MSVTSYKPRLDRVKVLRTSSLSVPASTVVSIPWQATEYDVAVNSSSGMWVSGDTITITRDGFYHVAVCCDWSATTGGTYRQSHIIGNAFTIKSEVVVSGITSDFRTIFQQQWMGALGPSFPNFEVSFSAQSNAGVATSLGTASTYATVTMLRPI